MENLIIGSANIMRGINSVKARGKRLVNDIQYLGLSCLNHIEEHGDTTLFNRLVEALPKGSRSNALRQWGLQFGKLDYTAKDGFVYARGKETRLEEADKEENKWWNFAPEPAFRPYDLNEKVIALFEAASKRAADENERDHIDTALLAELQKMAVGCGLEVRQ